jgi:hypothetical protein
MLEVGIGVEMSKIVWRSGHPLTRQEASE